MMRPPSLLFSLAEDRPYLWVPSFRVSARNFYTHRLLDCIYSAYLLGINAVVAVQAGQLTDPEYRAIPSLVAGVAAMAGGIPVIPPQFRPHEEVSDPDDYPVFSYFCFFVGFFQCLILMPPHRRRVPTVYRTVVINVPDSLEPSVFGPHESGSLIICSDPEPSINK